MRDFPFTAIIGQEALQTALMVAAVDQTVGGVLVRGQKGTAKSTAIRSLATLLPSIIEVADCPYHCSPEDADAMHTDCLSRYQAGEVLPHIWRSTPFVDLPLSATEDRLVGTLHIGKTLQTGDRHFEPGLLAAANRGILYVDEVNLLPDHLVDLLLDVSSSGVNLIEREGLRYSHPSRFVLIGSMNPEEGELRPQFLDRFGLCLSVCGLSQTDLRRQMVVNRLAFDQDPHGFCARYAEQEEFLRHQISQARARLPSMPISDAIIEDAVILAAEAKAQGHRAELTMVRTARALAALCERDAITRDDLEEAARFALPHRLGSSYGIPPEERAGQIEQLLRKNRPEQLPETKDFEETSHFDYDDIDFPGSAAAGSLLFTYLKKKSKTAIFGQTKPSR